ncbi:arylsulfatase [bacterium]|nr:arylsulfatase [Rubripirellula sp.]MDB4339106.1 arylsulfatase [Rubripirellula sp.]MDB4676596.1 arylsulfatase [bacterium]
MISALPHTRKLLCFTVVLLSQALAASAFGERPPNVVIFLADDQGWGDLSANQNPNLNTPSIDSLARDGATIEHFYVCAVCSPTRAEFLTGRYHTRSGVYSTSTGGERFNSDEETIADVFQMAGYATAAFGKWHSGMQYPYHPNARGFAEYYGFCSGHWGNYYSPMLEHNGQLVQGEGFIIDDLTNHAIDFIREHQQKPFFVYVPYNTPHSPMQVPDANWNRFKDKDIVPDPSSANARSEKVNHTRAALAMSQNIDENVGRVLDCLSELDLERDTVVIYFSDNGPNGSRYNGGMRGRKGSTHEGGLRVPFFIRYPQKIPAGSVLKQVGGAIDLLPTLADFAGIKHNSKKPLDGVSLAGALESNGAVVPERLLFSAWKQKASVRSQRFRYQSNGLLFDLSADPGETVDVAEMHPGTAKRLSDALQKWLRDSKAENGVKPENRPITVGHPQERQTQLPARDALPHGQVQRSNRFPNATYMTHWSGNQEDRITWEIEVLEGGEFEVEMYYACEASSVGAELELSFGEKKITTTIGMPHDVPLVGAEEDRVLRQEGYVKHWASMQLGSIELAKGPGTLELRANGVETKNVADMRLLMLKRVNRQR